MQIFTNKQKPKTDLKMKDLPIEDKQKLVSVFAWLIQEDKKQNPELYKINQKKYD